MQIDIELNVMPLTFMFMLFTLSCIEYQQTKTKKNKQKTTSSFFLTYAAQRIGYYQSDKMQA